MRFLGIEGVGVTPENGRSCSCRSPSWASSLLLSRTIRGAICLVLRRTDHASVQTRFWTRQAVSLLSAIVLVLGLLSIWFNDPTRLATALGLMSAGLAFALHRGRHRRALP